MIGVIDYKAGNAPSVMNALRYLGVPAAAVADAQTAAAMPGLILPGVGSARATMDSLREMGLVEAIAAHAAANKPFLGICIGFQVLFEFSEEGDTECLGLLPGCVRRFDAAVRVPQMGWNRVSFLRDDPILEGMPAAGYFYFVNSYYVEPDAPGIALGRTGYGESPFCSMGARGRLYGVQFHAEKSAGTGLRLLKNFAALAGEVAASC